MMKIFKSLFLGISCLILGISSTGAYLSDSVTVSDNTFTTDSWQPELKSIVINEIYYDTDSRTYQQGQSTKTEEEGKNEWIELYNPNDSAVNVKNYAIGDRYGDTLREFEINANIEIPAKNFLLLSHDNSTWHFWNDFTASTTNLGGSFGSGWLANGGDYVYLKDSLGNIIDQVCWGTDTEAFNPSVAIVSAGKSISRSVNGLDTNTAGDFIELMSPTPGS